MSIQPKKIRLANAKSNKIDNIKTVVINPTPIPSGSFYKNDFDLVNKSICVPCYSENGYFIIPENTIYEIESTNYDEIIYYSTLNIGSLVVSAVDIDDEGEDEPFSEIIVATAGYNRYGDNPRTNIFLYSASGHYVLTRDQLDSSVYDHKTPKIICLTPVKSITLPEMHGPDDYDTFSILITFDSDFVPIKDPTYGNDIPFYGDEITIGDGMLYYIILGADEDDSIVGSSYNGHVPFSVSIE